MNDEEIEIIDDNNKNKKLIIIVILLLLLICGFTIYILYDKGIIFNNKINNNVNHNENINNKNDENDDYITIKVTNYEENIIKIFKDNNIVYEKNKDLKVILDYGKLNDIDFKIKVSSFNAYQSIDIIVNGRVINYFSKETEGYAFAEFADAIWEFITPDEIYDTKIYIKLFDDKIALIYDSSTYFLSDRYLNAKISIYNKNGLVDEIKDLVKQYYLSFDDNNMKQCDIEFNNNEIKYCQLVGEFSGMHKINVVKYKDGVSTIVETFYGVANENI